MIAGAASLSDRRSLEEGEDLLRIVPLAASRAAVSWTLMTVPLPSRTTRRGTPFFTSRPGDGEVEVLFHSSHVDLEGDVDFGDRRRDLLVLGEGAVRARHRRTSSRRGSTRTLFFSFFAFATATTTFGLRVGVLVVDRWCRGLVGTGADATPGRVGRAASPGPGHPCRGGHRDRPERSTAASHAGQGRLPVRAGRTGSANRARRRRGRAGSSSLRRDSTEAASAFVGRFVGPDRVCLANTSYRRHHANRGGRPLVPASPCRPPGPICSFRFSSEFSAGPGRARAQRHAAGPLPLFPADNWWNADVSAAPRRRGQRRASSRGSARRRGLHPDFGGDAGATRRSTACRTSSCPGRSRSSR